MRRGRNALADQVAAHRVSPLIGERQVRSLRALGVGVALHDHVGVRVAVQRLRELIEAAVGTRRERAGAGVVEHLAREGDQQGFALLLHVRVGDLIDLLLLLLEVVPDAGAGEAAHRRADQGAAAALVVVDGGARSGAGQRAEDGALHALVVGHRAGVGRTGGQRARDRERQQHREDALRRTIHLSLLVLEGRARLGCSTAGGIRAARDAPWGLSCSLSPCRPRRMTALARPRRPAFAVTLFGPASH